MDYRRLTLAATLLSVLFSPFVRADEQGYQTHNVVIAVMDGVRWSETFGDPERTLIPNLDRLAEEGTLFSNFRNEGVTITRPGHSTIATGTWQIAANGGQRQSRPTLWEYAGDELGWPAEATAVVFGKGRYAYASRSSFPVYGTRFPAVVEIGIGEHELGDDAKVLERAIHHMATTQPRLMFINFGTTDHMGHSESWADYTAAVTDCDARLGELWQHIQATPGYQDRTTLLITNDHGRHDNRPAADHGGFWDHGDDCEGCQHVMLLALGPDIPKKSLISKKALLIDIAPTVGELLGFQTPLAEGRVLEEMLTTPLRRNRKEARTEIAKRAVQLTTLAERDLLRTVADAQLDRELEGLAPSHGVEVLMRGMLRAFEVTGDQRYLGFVNRWLETTEGPMTGRITTLRDDEQPSGSLAVEMLCAEGSPGRSEEEILAGWPPGWLSPPPMAQEKLPAAREVRPVTVSDAEELLRWVQALDGYPRNRVLRAAALVRQERLAGGLGEMGGIWDDPAVSAAGLYAALRMATVRFQYPMSWSKPGAKARKSKGKPTWSTPDRFYRGTFPQALDRLSLEVDAAGHLGDGSPFADGALLLLLAEAHGLEMRDGTRLPPARRTRPARGKPRELVVSCP